MIEVLHSLLFEDPILTPIPAILILVIIFIILFLFFLFIPFLIVFFYSSSFSQPFSLFLFLSLYLSICTCTCPPSILDSSQTQILLYIIFMLYFFNYFISMIGGDILSCIGSSTFFLISSIFLFTISITVDLVYHQIPPMLCFY